MSEFLSRIDRELAIETDPSRRGVLFARRGSYYARIGRFADAKTTISQLRIEYGDATRHRVSIWIMLLEGILELYENLSPSAYDRIIRAQLLSNGFRDAELIAISSAWRAHLEFERSDFAAMVEAITIVLDTAPKDDHESRARVSRVLADAFMLTGDRNASNKWFMRARSHALDAGDQAMIDALIYNRAAFGLAWQRILQCTQPIEQANLRVLRSEISSARNFQTMINAAALTHLIDLIDIRWSILNGDYELAVNRLGNVIGSGPFASNNFRPELIEYDVAFCLAKMGRADDAIRRMAAISRENLVGLDVDDRMIISWMELQLCTLDPRFGSIDDASRHFESMRLEFEAMNSSLINMIKPFAYS